MEPTYRAGSAQPRQPPRVSVLEPRRAATSSRSGWPACTCSISSASSALPGERVSDHQGEVRIDGVPLTEPYVHYRRPWDAARRSRWAGRILRRGRQSRHERRRSHVRPSRMPSRIVGPRGVLSVAAAPQRFCSLLVAWRPVAAVCVDAIDRATRPRSSGASRRSPAEVNESTTDGRGPRRRAPRSWAPISPRTRSIDLDKGTAAIRGRATVMDMASRLQPRTSAFTAAS